MRLKWSRLAFEDREAIFDYIRRDSPRAAISIDDSISDATGCLIDHPERGRPGRADGTRELVIAGTPYIVVYSVAIDTIQVLRVLHGSRLWPEEPSD